jgi:TolB protein
MHSNRWLVAPLAVACASLLLACGPSASALEAKPASQPTSQAGAGLAQLFLSGAQLSDGSSLQGRLLFVKDGNLWLWEKGSAREIAVGETWHQPRWAPDGTRFAYVYRAPNFSEIFVADSEGKTQTRLTRSQSAVLGDNDWNLHPTWSPDGKQIAFVSDASNSVNVSSNLTLWVMNQDGSGRRPVATPGVPQEAVDGLAWSPDGSLLAVTVFSGLGPGQLALLPMAGSTRQPARVITEYPDGATDPSWSPDGKWLAYAARDGLSVDLFVMQADSAIQADGMATRRLTNTGMARSPAWSPDGRHLAYLSVQGSGFELWVLDLEETPAGGLEAQNARQLTRDLGLDAASGVSWGR